MFSNQIYQDTRNKKHKTITNLISYDNNIYTQDYINQFLNLSDEDEQNCHASSFENNSPIKKISNLRAGGDNKSIQGLQDANLKVQSKRSIYHNFQKHLVITLRSLISFDKYQSFNNVISLSKKMWKIFISSNNHNKYFLHILFGQYQDDDISIYTHCQYGFGKIIQDYPANIIRQAQNFLRKETLVQFQQTNLENYLQQRRMKKKEQFLDYLKFFFETMKMGPIKKRIYKAKKNNSQIPVYSPQTMESQISFASKMKKLY